MLREATRKLRLGREAGVAGSLVQDGLELANVDGFGEPRVSGDDCHETAATQLGYFAAAGLQETRALWQQELWTLLSGRRVI